MSSRRHHLRQMEGMPHSSRSATSSPRWPTWPSATPAPTARAARDYLDAFSKRREIVAQSSGKYELLGHLANAIRGAHGALRVHRDRRPRTTPSTGWNRWCRSTSSPGRRLGATDEILDDLRVRARRRRRAPGARRGHRRARRQPRDRHEREPDPAPDDPADGAHPASQAPGVAARLRDHVRQGHPGGPGDPHRAGRLPRRDRAHLRGDPRLRRRRLRGTRRLPRRAGPPRSPTRSTSSTTRAAAAAGARGDRIATAWASRRPTRSSPSPVRTGAAVVLDQLEAGLPRPARRSAVPRHRAPRVSRRSPHRW